MGRNVSSTYKTIMSKDILPLTHYRVTFGIEAPGAESEAVLSIPSEFGQQAAWSDVTKIKNQIMPTSNYLTCELNSFVLGDSHKLLPNYVSSYVKDKYTSENLSNANCEFTSLYPCIEINFTNPQTIMGITFFFDEIEKTFASEMQIVGFNSSGSITKTLNCYPTSKDYISDSLENVTKIRIYIKKTNLPYRKATIARLYFGIKREFTESDSSGVSQTFTMSPINNKLYKSTFNVSLDNFDLQYNIDNKKGIYEYLTEQQPMKIEYSLDNEEWILCGNYLTSGKSKISGNIANIEAIDKIQYMNDQYKKEVYRSTAISLYNLAYNLLIDFGWNPNADGSYSFDIDNSLRNITTKGILPSGTYAECLQVIASAGNVALYTDDRGYICLKPLPSTASDSSYIIDFNNCTSYPEPEEIEPLSQVDVAVHNYSVEANQSELNKSTYVISGTQTLMIDYNLSTNQTATIPTGVTLNASRFYGRYCELDVTGNGTYEITINGYQVSDNTSTVSVVNQNSGEIAPLDNPLITDNTRATAIGTYAKNYLKERIRYTIPWLQDYRVNVGDLVYIKTQFSEELLCRVIEIKTSEPAMTGTMKVVVISDT